MVLSAHQPTSRKRRPGTRWDTPMLAPPENLRDRTRILIELFNGKEVRDAEVSLPIDALHFFNRERERAAEEYAVAQFEPGPGVLGMSASASRMASQIAAYDALLDQMDYPRGNKRSRVHITATDGRPR